MPEIMAHLGMLRALLLAWRAAAECAFVARGFAEQGNGMHRAGERFQPRTELGKVLQNGFTSRGLEIRNLDHS